MTHDFPSSLASFSFTRRRFAALCCAALVTGFTAGCDKSSAPAATAVAADKIPVGICELVEHEALDLSVKGFLDELAARGTTVYEISGRCGVYAKTDIQPLLNQGASKADLALSAFHAIAKQTLGGLAQGLDVVPPVIFGGGPLTFNPTLVRVFCERLHLVDG